MTTLSTAVEKGTELYRVSRTVTRDRLVRYAGASGDFNPIHYNDRFATEVGLPGVIAHGMLTMGLACATLTDWLDDPADLLSYGVRFTRPVPVPDPGEVALEVRAVVGAVDPEAGTARIDLAVTLEGTSVLGKSQAQVRLH
ncbi:acyl dehydratase [Ruania alkalisoli]|uniref:Acyl dehydratase n=1 Tax=Ruania alkalisoli TaxID=2779775 RepID=A0A7M1SS90_9MICO|nr:MaoC/PaaZ C-terminal domain-containing protein [Ruania alkalisoli]QOR70007.1 acyl dehydratase [Ruania alkalisoli]